MNVISETTTADSTAGIACQLLKTGRLDCIAHFYPARYQLVLISSGHEEKLDLGYSGSRLLERLLQTPGEVIPRDELMSHAWADRVVGQGSLNQQIYTLRQVLGDEKARQIIQTLPRRGYLLNPDYVVCCPAPECNTSALIDPAPTSNPHNSMQRNRRLNLSGLITVLSLLSTLILAYLYLSNPQQTLYSSELKLGLLNVRFLEGDPQQLQALMLKTHNLTSLLEQLSQQPAQLIIAQDDGVIELLCQHHDGALQALELNEAMLPQLNAAHVSGCLP